MTKLIGIIYIINYPIQSFCNQEILKSLIVEDLLLCVRNILSYISKYSKFDVFGDAKNDTLVSGKL